MFATLDVEKLPIDFIKKSAREGLTHRGLVKYFLKFDSRFKQLYYIKCI